MQDDSAGDGDESTEEAAAALNVTTNVTVLWERPPYWYEFVTEVGGICEKISFAFNTTALRNPMTGMASAAIAFTTAECRARNQRALSAPAAARWWIDRSKKSSCAPPPSGNACSST